FNIPRVLIVVTIETQQLPIAAVGRIVVVIVVLVMDREFTKICAGKFASTTPTYPGIEL
ncbi:hypothetical protein THIOM_002586, partial [Candidatus Thiomargarita nelsonii]